MVRRSLSFAGPGWWCERCERWFRTREIADGIECVTPKERARLRKETLRPAPREFCTCERRKARRDVKQDRTKCTVCGLAWLP